LKLTAEKTVLIEYFADFDLKIAVLAKTMMLILQEEKKTSSFMSKPSLQRKN